MESMILIHAIFSEVKKGQVKEITFPSPIQEEIWVVDDFRSSYQPGTGRQCWFSRRRSQHLFTFRFSTSA